MVETLVIFIGVGSIFLLGGLILNYNFVRALTRKEEGNLTLIGTSLVISSSGFLIMLDPIVGNHLAITTLLGVSILGIAFTVITHPMLRIAVSLRRRMRRRKYQWQYRQGNELK